MSKLSVIIPLYNKAKYISMCLDSVLSSQSKDIEIIVVDDGSTDGGGKICDEVAQKDSRVHVIHGENKGLSMARSIGIKECQSEYVTFVDADDYILEGAYSDAFEYMDAGVDMIVYEISRLYDDQVVLTEKHKLEAGYYDAAKIREQILGRLIWNLSENTRGLECSLCVRIAKKELLLKQYESLNTSLYYGEDAAITYSLYLNIKDLQVIPRSYYIHRQVGGTSRPYVESDTFFDECYKVYKYLDTVISQMGADNQLKQQLEYFYIEAVKLKKTKYNDRRDNFYFLFPFEYVRPNKRIVLYGAGRVGNDYYQQISSIAYCVEVLWVDKNAKALGNQMVQEVEELYSYPYDCVVIAINNKNICEEVKQELIQGGVTEDKIVYRIQEW